MCKNRVFNFYLQNATRYVMPPAPAKRASLARRVQVLEASSR
jgi:hypothetical protein